MCPEAEISEERLDRLGEENRVLRTELDGLRRFLRSTCSIAEALDRPCDEGQVLGLLEQILDSTLFAIGAEGGSLLVPEESSGDLVFALVRGESPPEDLVGTRIPAGRGIAAWVAANRQAAIVNDTVSDDRFYREVDDRFSHRTRSVIAAPLLGGERLLGVIEMVNRQGGRLFSLSNQTLLMLMCRFAGELLYALVRDLDLSRTIEHTAAGAARRDRDHP